MHVQSAADLLAAHRLEQKAFPGFPANLQPADEGEAYAVQDALHELLALADGRSVAGHKIGCTTPVMQRYMAIPSPCAGGVFENTVHHGDAVLVHEDYVRVGVECELAVRLSVDLLADNGPFELSGVRDTIAAVMPAIEIVEDRYEDFSSLPTPTLIADDFFGAGCILGRETTDWGDLHLSSVSAQMLIDGSEVGSGTGSDILGDPLNALLWLANSRAARSRSLLAGDIVLLGSLVQTHWVERGQTVVVDNAALGTVTVRFR